MDNNTEEKKGRALTAEEEKEFREGGALYEMDQNSQGWQIIKKMLETLAFHSWVDPRECENEKDFVWREVNAFHAANNAKELLETIQKSISKTDYLAKLKSGEIKTRSMKI